MDGKMDGNLTMVGVAPFALPYGINGTVVHQNQSYRFNFSDWITLFTLCFAPLVAHILAGVPSPVYTHPTRPAWHDRLIMYNPTTIIWRYLAITDRRIRTRNWDTTELATVNAVFWSSSGWDGSEVMARNSKSLLSRRPLSTRSWLSSANVTTVVITLQGIQAISNIVKVLRGWNVFEDDSSSITTVFSYLSVLGLLRLPAAYWITDDYVFEDAPAATTLPFPSREEASSRLLSYDITKQSLSSQDTSLDLSPVEIQRHPAMNWKSILLRLSMTICVATLGAISFYTALPLPAKTASAKRVATFSGLLQSYLYTLLMAPAALIIGFYSLSAETSTILPCVRLTWYKVFTLVWYALVLVTVVFAGLETTRTSCGNYTTFPIQAVERAITSDGGCRI